MKSLKERLDNANSLADHTRSIAKVKERMGEDPSVKVILRNESTIEIRDPDFRGKFLALVDEYHAHVEALSKKANDQIAMIEQLLNGE